MKNENQKRIFMKPGKTNKEDRLNFIKFWANYIKTHSDKEWSEQQKMLIDSQIKNVKKLAKKPVLPTSS
ncbi:hypothetical protein BMS3Abin17_00538 [archaeon BMS3Abin17]|nr:hypothetical protein BMS3Abin17_00538 [archaeon BMS3Abin17]